MLTPRPRAQAMRVWTQWCTYHRHEANRFARISADIDANLSPGGCDREVLLDTPAALSSDARPRVLEDGPNGEVRSPRSVSFSSDDPRLPRQPSPLKECAMQPVGAAAMSRPVLAPPERTSPRTPVGHAAFVEIGGGSAA